MKNFNKLFEAMPALTNVLKVYCTMNDNRRVWKVEFAQYEGIGSSVDEACSRVLTAMSEHAAQLQQFTSDAVSP